MDRNYCLIRVSLQKNIILYLYASAIIKQSPVCLLADSSNQMYTLMSIHNSFRNLSMGHFLYLGQELYKAELALKFGQQYLQD